MSLIRFIARPMLATAFVAGGVTRLRRTEETAEALRPYLDKLQKAVPSAAALAGRERLVARGLGGIQMGAAVLLGIGRFSRCAALLLSATASVNACVEFTSADTSTPEARARRRSVLLRDVSLIGGVLLAAVDTAGNPSLAWRAGHLGHEARRNAKGLTRTAKKELKKAEKAVKSTAANVMGS